MLLVLINKGKGMQSSSEQPLVGGSLRDDPNNGCEGDYGAWFLRVIMLSSRASYCLALAKKQKNDFNFFPFNV